MFLRGPLSRSWWRGFLNFSVWEKWKMVPGSETSSRPRTLNCPPYTFSPFGSLAFRYSSEKWEFVVIFQNFHSLTTHIRNISQLPWRLRLLIWRQRYKWTISCSCKPLVTSSPGNKVFYGKSLNSFPSPVHLDIIICCWWGATEQLVISSRGDTVLQLE